MPGEDPNLPFPAEETPQRARPAHARAGRLPPAPAGRRTEPAAPGPWQPAVGSGQRAAPPPEERPGTAGTGAGWPRRRRGDGDPLNGALESKGCGGTSLCIYFIQSLVLLTIFSVTEKKKGQ